MKNLTLDWSRSNTTEMAGRVERRINDKFYFVLDEVGGSSDCESELTSDIDVKPTDCSILKDIVTNDNEALVIKDNASLNHLGDINSDVKMLTDTSHLTDVSCRRISDNERKEKNKSSDSYNNKEKVTQKIKNNVYPEESSSIVDMDIESDVESNEPKIQEPILKITFRDEFVEKRLKQSFFKFISQKFENFTAITNSENSLEIEVYDDTRNLPENELLDFNLDTTPGSNHIDIPNYGKKFDLVLSDTTAEGKQDSRKLRTGSTSCFNCLGNHNLRDCPKAKDFKIINKNRLKFQSQKEKPVKTSRYHLDENQKFSHLYPGIISKKLRNALNLKRNQQPGFIYRMRLLGYPPAWLEEAKVSHSGVAMYDDTGVPVLEEDEEEGEILPEGAKDKFDITKIIDFPGFNVPLPNSFKDESKYYQCPALSDEQSKENLIKLLKPKTVQAYVKKTLSNQKSEEKLLPRNELKRTASPTIEEMEEKKRQLLMELNSEDSTSDSKNISEYSFACQTPTVSESCANKKVGTVKNLEFGTPILKSVSPFSKLPSRELFSCNVSDVVNFENLPNSTGKYETMREVIEKIRISTAKSQKE